MDTIRLHSQMVERQTLSPLAVLSENTAGRVRPEAECSIRTPFQRDRDRIIHCKAFRRLKHKTQVFLSPEGDHYRTRLTHTLEVSQIARTIAKALRLNEDLTEAIALGHDLGHTPFGHAGERALNQISGHFCHYEQSVRICEKLEKNGQGLNLTEEVLDGILHHTKGEQAHTLEGRIVRISDRIAYINHDIDDAVRAGVIRLEDIPGDLQSVLGYTKSQRINTLVFSVIQNSKNDICMEETVFEAFDRLHSFLYDRVYLNPVAKSEESKVPGILQGLYSYYLEHTDEIPEEYQHILRTEGPQAAIIDHIAGMTDRYAIAEYNRIFIPLGWDLVR